MTSHKNTSTSRPVLKLDDTLVFFLLFLPMFWMGMGSNDTHEKEDNAVFWEISGNGLDAPSYLLGTYHLMKAPYLDALPGVQERLQGADGIVVETVLDTAAMMKMSMALVMQGQTLEDLMPKKEYKQLEKIWERQTGGGLGMVKMFKPVAVSGQLIGMFDHDDVAAYMDGPELPMDMHIAQTAKQKGLPVHSLETLEFQMDLLYGQPLEEQTQVLVETVRRYDEFLVMARELMDLYMAQDLAGMGQLEEKYGDLATMGLEMDELLTVRNEKWMAQMPDLLAEGNQFIAVGTLHLLGEEGLLHQLRAAGYTLTPIKG